MAKKTQSPYAKAYSFGTDGNAALAGSPISSHRPSNTPRRSAPKKQRGLQVPRWIVYGVMMVMVIFVCAFYLDNVSSEVALDRELYQLQSDIVRIEQQTQALGEDLGRASDETRIRSLAVNRLGMQLPVAEQIVRIPAAQPAPQIAALPEAEQEPLDLIRLLLSTIGL